MKRLIPLMLLVVTMLLALAACGEAELTEFVSTEVGQSKVGTVESFPATDAKTADRARKLAESSQTPDAQIKPEIIPCPMHLPAGEVDGETIVCGQITVPENWDNPGERTIDITYAILKAKSLSPFPEPIIYLEGGPGGTALEDIEKLSNYFVKLRTTRDVIYYDQRGTDYSGNLDCPVKVMYGEVLDEFGRSPEDEDVTDDDDADAEETTVESEETAAIDPEAQPATPQPLYEQDPQEVLDEYRGANVPTETNCHDYFVEQGVDLTQYTTAASVRDLTALMNGLEYDAYNVYGVSYGSRLGLELMRAYEEEGSEIPEIHSIVIDGIDPPHVDIITQHPFMNMYIVLDALSACEADEACGDAYPNIRQRAVDLLAQVEEEPVMLTSSTGMTETVSVPYLALMLGGNSTAYTGDLSPVTSPMAIPYLPRLVDEFSRGVGDVYMGLVAGTLPPAAETEPVLNRNQFDPMAVRTEQMAGEAKALSDELQALSAQMQRVSEAQINDEPLPELFVRELIHLESENPSFDEIKPQFGAILMIMAASEPIRENLEGALEAFQLDEVDKASLGALIAMMSDEEVAETYNLLLSDRVLEQLIEAIQWQMNTVVTCNDLYPSFDIDAAFEAYQKAEAPQLLNQIEVFLSYYARCERYGLAEGPGESSEPVTTSLPTLIINGSVDKNTAARWGESTFDYLPNAQMVTVPLAAHGASALSACGQDITYAFFTYPEEEVNDACTEALQPVFVLPDDDLGLSAGDE